MKEISNIIVFVAEVSRKDILKFKTMVLMLSF